VKLGEGADTYLLISFLLQRKLKNLNDEDEGCFSAHCDRNFETEHIE
jgi:hypothetical protein